MRYLRLNDEQQVEEADLLTRDGFRIPVKVKKEFISFDIDQKVPELCIKPFTENLIVYYFEIE